MLRRPTGWTVIVEFCRVCAMPRMPHTSPQTLRLFEALLAAPPRWRYGYALSRETGLASGTLYPILMRLTDQRLRDTGWESSDEPGRPPRHTYRLTRSAFSVQDAFVYSIVMVKVGTPDRIIPL